MNMNTVAVSVDNRLREGEILLPLSHVDDRPDYVDVIRLPFQPPIVDTLWDNILNMIRKVFHKPVKHRYDVTTPPIYHMSVVGRTDGEFVTISSVDAGKMGCDFDGDTITYAYE